MISNKLHALANLLYDWTLIAPHRRAPVGLVFELEEFQNYAKYFTGQSFTLQDIHEAAHLLSDMELLELIDGWPREYNKDLLQLVDYERLNYSSREIGLL